MMKEGLIVTGKLFSAACALSDHFNRLLLAFLFLLSFVSVSLYTESGAACGCVNPLGRKVDRFLSAFALTLANGMRFDDGVVDSVFFLGRV